MKIKLMKTAFISISVALLALLVMAAVPAEKGKGEGGKGGSGQSGGAGGQVEPAVVPPYLFNVWLCRPGADSMTVSVLAWENLDAFIEYGDGL